MAVSDEAVSTQLDNAMDWVFKAADLVSQYFDGEEKEAQLKDLDLVMQQLCTSDRKFVLSRKIITRMEEENAENGDTACEPLEYNDLKSSLDESIEKNRSKLDHKKHDKYTEFLTKLNPAAEDDANDEELVCTETEVMIKDPYTKAFIENPIKNRQCNHHYDKAYVVNMLKKKKKAMCPIPGCRSKKPFTLEDLVEDRQLTKKVRELVQKSQETGASTSGINVSDNL